MEKTVDIWEKSLSDIRKEVGTSVFELWFEPIKPSMLDDGKIVLDVPNRFFKEWIEDYHPNLISKVIERHLGEPVDVEFTIVARSTPKIARVEASREKRKDRLARKGIYLNPKYTFDNFVVGASNEFACAAAEAVCKNPGMTYNPLFIYGGVGLGKTHLTMAVGNHIVDKKRNFNVQYVSAEQFTNEVVSAIRHSKTEELKEKFRSLDMLLIDDIQFIENKPTTQDELFHTLNTLYQSQKQIVLSSDRPPMEISKVTDRLRSRFSMGLIADIQPPDIETRIAIIQKKTEAEMMHLPEDVVHFIATKVKSNIRDIEGCLIRLGAHMSLTGAQANLPVVKKILKDFITEDDRPLTVESIMKSVADHYGIRVPDMKSKKRTKDIALPRQVAMYISRAITEASLSEIGKVIGGKDHATVIYATKQIESRRTKDESFDRMIDNLISKLRQ
ncbi:MAG TPA: chromosomal replication initiator protein DnaA [Nitrospirae bacterium]|nr:chromosomal replication initiator protein DnaA [Nitrospirota bacterium]